MQLAVKLHKSALETCGIVMAAEGGIDAADETWEEIIFTQIYRIK